MRAKVAAVEHALSAGFDEQGVRIEGTVIDEIRRDREWSNLHRCSMLQATRDAAVEPARRPECCLAKNSFRRGAHVDRRIGMNRANLSNVVLVRM